MNTINKEEYPEVFCENEEPVMEDIQYFNNLDYSKMSDNERIFFEKMREKVEGEFAPSADIILLETENDDEIYIIRYYYEEFRVGKGLYGHRKLDKIYTENFHEFIEADMYILLGYHISVIEWLRKTNFKGINYIGNTIFNHYGRI